jgi:hypothetical protein
VKLDPLPENQFPQLKLDQLMEENRFAHLVLDLEYHAVQLTRQLGEVRPHLNIDNNSQAARTINTNI